MTTITETIQHADDVRPVGPVAWLTGRDWHRTAILDHIAGYGCDYSFALADGEDESDQYHAEAWLIVEKFGDYACTYAQGRQAEEECARFLNAISEGNLLRCVTEWELQLYKGRKDEDAELYAATGIARMDYPDLFNHAEDKLLELTNDYYRDKWQRQQ